jgi:hypothetical protein
LTKVSTVRWSEVLTRWQLVPADPTTGWSTPIRWSVRSDARTNDLDAGEDRHRIGTTIDEPVSLRLAVAFEELAVAI